MFSSRPLIVYGVTAEEWTARYGVEPFSHPCYECGRLSTTSLPFAEGTLRGLKAPVCPCGNTKMPYAVTRDPKHGDLLVVPPKPPRKKDIAKRRPCPVLPWRTR